MIIGIDADTMKKKKVYIARQSNGFLVIADVPLRREISGYDRRGLDNEYVCQEPAFWKIMKDGKITWLRGGTSEYSSINSLTRDIENIRFKDEPLEIEVSEEDYKVIFQDVSELESYPVIRTEEEFVDYIMKEFDHHFAQDSIRYALRKGYEALMRVKARKE